MKLANFKKDKSLIIKIFLYFLIWRVILFIISAISPVIIPNFGNQFPYWNNVLTTSGLPYWIWQFGNFDGVHYLRIAEGYISDFSQVFFPLYPLTIVGLTVNGYYLLTALLVSNVLFFFSLILFWRLLEIDFNPTVARNSVLVLLTFPNSYYFGAVYTESLFLFLVLSFFYLVRKKYFLAAGICAALASATRIIGILLCPILILEVYLAIRNKDVKSDFFKYLIGILLSPLGLIYYMVTLKLQFNDPLFFLNAQTMVNTQRANHFISLPQVLFRYLKILSSINFYSQQFFNAFLEFFSTLAIGGLIIYSFKKIRLSYWLFSVGAFLMPTVTGTLSSMPRYILLDFLLIPVLVILLGEKFKLFLVLNILVQIMLATLFLRGYWIA